jgi:hypothetical protein
MKMFKLMEYSDVLETTSIGVISQNMDYTYTWMEKKEWLN